MDQLRLSRRSRRRERRNRLMLVAWVVSTGAMVAGAPTGDTSLGWVHRVLSRAGGPEAIAVEATESAAATLRFRREVFDARPAPERRPAEPAGAEEAPAAPAQAAGSIGAIVYAAAAEFGLSGDYLLSVAHCESTLDPQAYNPAGYYGLFQFDHQTWAAYGYGSIYDPVAQARTAARLLAAGQSSRWPNCA